MTIEMVLAIAGAIVGALCGVIALLFRELLKTLRELSEVHKTSAKELDLTARKVAETQTAQTAAFERQQQAYERSAEAQTALSQTVQGLVNHVTFLSMKAGMEPTPPPFPAVGAKERR